MSEKSPISILQEYYMKKGLIPFYTTVDESSEKTGPFTIKVEAEGRSAVGSGGSKKQAKHNAAVAMLQLLKNDSSTNQQASPDIPEVPKRKAPVYDQPVRPNFVGKLHEYMIKRKAPIPTYELVNEEGPPHMRHFTMRCIVKDMQEEGTARSKQEAKNIAAEKVWEKLNCAGEADDCLKPKRRRLVNDEEFDKVLKKFRSMMDDLGASFHFEEETPKEYAIDAAGNTDELKHFNDEDRKMFSFLGTRSFTSLLPEKTSIILNFDTGEDSRTIGARGWTRRDAMYKALSDGIEHLSKPDNKFIEKNGDEQPNYVEA